MGARHDLATTSAGHSLFVKGVLRALPVSEVLRDPQVEDDSL